MYVVVFLFVGGVIRVKVMGATSSELLLVFCT